MDAATTRHEQYSQPEQVLYVALELSLRTWKLGMTVGFVTATPKFPPCSRLKFPPS